MKLTISSPDSLGILAGTLCLVHCAATPFLFVFLAGASGASEHAPIWWLALNNFFLIVSFFAVLRSSKTTSRNIMKPLLWIGWGTLSFILLNEQFGLIEIPELFSYLTATFLIVLHIFNRKYCHCTSDTCCAT